VQDQKQSLLAAMNQQYYWYRQMPAGDASVGTMDAYFQSLLYRPTDRYSFSQATAAFDQLFVDGRKVGYGYSLNWDPNRQLLQVRMVEPLSPVAKAGLQRGDTILRIDGKSPAQVMAGELATVSTPGVLRTFEIQDVQGTPRVLQVASADFALSPVAYSNIYAVTRSDGSRATVGYLVYHQFVTYGATELNNALDTFRSSGVNELVLDLRYNGGGSVSVSRDLASYIGGTLTSGKVYTQLRFNDRNPGSNSTYSFLVRLPSQGLADLKRVVVIASGDTASASELLVNGLRPFMPVTLVGETTYGKPYGFVPRSYCGITYNAVNFETVNSLGVGGYTSGFSPDCNVADDLNHPFGDPTERRLRVALNYIATGTCGNLAAPARGRLPNVPAGEVVAPGMFPG
jgi:C-terminal processing protease CtpA/Prc